MARNKYLNRNEFRLFLAQAGNDVVGDTRKSRSCPISTYLMKQTNRTWQVSALACVPWVDSEVEDNEFRPPKWARQFLHALDRQFGRKPRQITGIEALYVLNEAVA